MQPPADVSPVRVITDLETMRTLSDPTRIAILRVLMSGGRSAPVMSAKEIAAALGEPQTKLYRHLKQLEAAGLIQVAETRLVSGIQEQRYRTAQLTFTLSGDLVTDPSASTEFADTLSSVFSEFHTQLTGNLSAGRVPIGTEAETPLGLLIGRGMVARVSPVRAADFRRRLLALQNEFDTLADDDPSGIPVHLLIGWYAVVDPE
ncbi:ArsR/SmtB family transcription factor [Kribbella sp. NPDC050241]|uniref:ArsR/SmtB family transcription factor n=1 Tax=Kribbella sp. NPDC050241 TaxID=3364115 RepID=UPI0037B39AEE